MADPESIPEEVVHRATNGDPAAFRIIYDFHLERVHAICLRMGPDRQRAMELTHDVFVRVWEKLGTFRRESSLATWIHRLAVNMVLMEARTRDRRERRVEGVGDLEVLGAAAPADCIGERLDLEAAISRLPDGARQVFVLREIEGYEYSEISAVMGITEGTARSQLHRARQLLMPMLGL
jgi:RNA polymerase sigma-70 factor (ECF subfamily)